MSSQILILKQLFLSHLASTVNVLSSYTVVSTCDGSQKLCLANYTRCTVIYYFMIYQRILISHAHTILPCKRILGFTIKNLAAWFMLLQLPKPQRFSIFSNDRHHSFIQNTSLYTLYIDTLKKYFVIKN